MTALKAKMLDGGKVIVPISLRKLHHLEKGDTIVFESDGETVRMRGLAATVDRLQGRLASYRTDVLASDELIADRRTEA